MKSPAQLFAAVVAAAALVLTGCASDPGGPSTDPPPAGPERADKLTLTGILALRSFDIGHGAEWGNPSILLEAVYDTVLRTSSSGETIPWLATSWEYDDSLTELTLDLRTDARFSDGTPVDASAVVASLEYYRDGTAPEAPSMAGNSYSVVDEDTVLITLDRPNPSLLHLLTRVQGVIQAPSSFGDADAATKPVGSGPYLLDTGATVAGTSYTFHANPDYWNPEAVRYDNLVINIIADQTAALNALRAGDANGVKLAANNLNAEVEAAGWTIKTQQLDVHSLILLDRGGQMSPEIGDVRVRQAINKAFDRQALLDVVQAGYGTVTEQMFPPASAGYDAALENTYGYDPEGAKKLLAEAGYPDGFTLRLPLNPVRQAMFDLIGQQLSEVGITVEYTDPGPGNYIAEMLAPRFPAAWMSNEQGDDWRLVNQLITLQAPFNPFRYQDEFVEEHLPKLLRGGAEADAAAAAINKYLVEQAWFAPLYRVQGNFAVDANTELDFWPTGPYPSLFDFRPKG